MTQTSLTNWKALSATAALFLTPGIAWCQGGKPTGIVSVEPSSSVSVRVEVRASGNQLVVPYCGEDETGIRVLCSGAAALEVASGQGWVPARPKKEGQIPGAVPREQWRTAIINSGGRRYFVFSFSKEFFGVRQGQRLRIKIGTWADAESMKAGTSAVQLTSPPFGCP
jgi:hypothetical protein